MNRSCKLSFPLHPEPVMNDPGMCKSSIGHGSSLGIKFFVTKENTELTWKIKMKRGRIKFGVFRRPIKDLSGPAETANGNGSCRQHRDNDSGESYQASSVNVCRRESSICFTLLSFCFVMTSL
jgi:hypothetical protein